MTQKPEDKPRADRFGWTDDEGLIYRDENGKQLTKREWKALIKERAQASRNNTMNEAIRSSVKGG